MKSTIKMRVIYCALFCLMAPTCAVLAQDFDDDDTPPPPPPPMNCPQQMAPPQCGMQRGGQRMEPRHHKGDMLKKLQEDLSLTDEQVQAMKELHKTMVAKRKEAVKEAMKTVDAQDNAELKKILTEEQYKEFTEKRDQMRARINDHVKGRKEQRRNRDFGPPPPLCEEDDEV